MKTNGVDDPEWIDAFTWCRYVIATPEDAENWDWDVEFDRSRQLLWGTERIPGLRIFDDPLKNAGSVAQGFTESRWRNNSPVENWHATSGLGALDDADMMRHNAATARLCIPYFENFFVSDQPIQWRDLFESVFDLDRAFPNGQTPRELGAEAELDEWQQALNRHLENLLFQQAELGDSVNVLPFFMPFLCQKPDYWPHPLFPDCVEENLVAHSGTVKAEVLERLKPILLEGPDLLSKEQAEEFLDHWTLGVSPPMSGSAVRLFFYGQT